MKIIWGFPGWGWRMYGVISLRKGHMWFLGFSSQITHTADEILSFNAVPPREVSDNGNIL